jgi:hypothetical protein
MRSEAQKKAIVATFLDRSALLLLIAPAGSFFWALKTGSPHDALWQCFATAAYIWPVAGVLFIIAVGFHAPSTRQRRDTPELARFRVTSGASGRYKH